jgi:hypothetical protein
VRKPDDLETYLFVVVFHAGGAEFYICQWDWQHGAQHAYSIPQISCCFWRWTSWWRQ